MRFVSFLFLFSLVPRANAQSDAIASKPIALSSYVNPFIGTGGHGHTFPGATVPFGIIQKL